MTYTYKKYSSSSSSISKKYRLEGCVVSLRKQLSYMVGCQSYGDIEVQLIGDNHDILNTVKFK